MRYLGVHKKVGGDTARSWLTQTDQSDVPWQHVVSRSAITAEVKKEKGRLLEWWHFSFQETVMHFDTCFPSWRWLSMGNTCLSMGNSEWIPWFAVLVCIQLLLCLLNCLYFNPWILTFTFWILSPNHLGRVSKHLCGTELPAGAKPQLWIVLACSKLCEYSHPGDQKRLKRWIFQKTYTN